MSKLGIAMIEWQTEGVLWAIENKPTAVEFMMVRPLDTRPMEEIRPGVKVSQVDLVRMLAEASPKTLLIIRAYPDDYGHPDFQDRMLSWSEPFREVSDRVVAHSVNEPVIFNADNAKGLNDYEIGFIERMTKEGLIPMCFCLSESHLGGPTIERIQNGFETGKVVDWGNLPLWQYMKDGVRLLGEKGGFLGFNEYDWPDWNSSRAWGHKWRLGHWELNLEFIRKYVAPEYIPRVGIGEGVLDGKIWTPRLPHDDPRYDKPWGYRKIKDSEGYLLDIDGIHRDSYSKPEVAFNLLFAWAPQHPHWDPYDVSAMKEPLAEHLRQNPPIYWEDQQEPMEQPIEDESTIKALDVSEWGELITEEQWQGAYKAGYRLAIVQAWGGGPIPGGANKYCEQQLGAARRAGLLTAIYFHLPSDTTTQTHLFMPVIKKAAGDEYEYARFVTVDIEGDKPLHPTDPVARLKDAISHITDKPVVIYSSRHMWNVVMGGASGFQQYPLWDARYDGKPELDTNWIPYGGWVQRAIKQYKGTTTVPNGISADLNVVSLKRLSLNAEEPPQEPSIDIEAIRKEAKATKTLAEGIIGRAEAIENLLEA